MTLRPDQPRGPATVLWGATLECAFLAQETASVMAIRSVRLAGLTPAARAEALRMVAEKPPAFADATRAAWRAALDGRGAHEVLVAALRPLRQQIRANVDRLAGRG